MSARVATVCDSTTCTQVLVRGDRISFVSVEQAQKVGCGLGGGDACPMERDDRKMPADIKKIPKNYVIVADEDGVIFGRCDYYIVRWHGARGVLDRDDVSRRAQEYYGDIKIRGGEVEVPSGPWARVCKVRFIRYRRYGVSQDPNDLGNLIDNPRGRADMEHEYDPPVWLYRCARPLAWRLDLPGNCRVTAHGFEKP